MTSALSTIVLCSRSIREFVDARYGNPRAITAREFFSDCRRSYGGASEAGDVPELVGQVHAVEAAQLGQHRVRPFVATNRRSRAPA